MFNEDQKGKEENISHNSNISPNVVEEYYEEQVDELKTPAGGLQIKTSLKREGFLSDDSYVLLQDAWGALMRLFTGNIVISSTGDFTTSSLGNLSVSVKGGRQEVVSGNHNSYIEGDVSEIVGSQTDSDKNTLGEIYNLSKQIQDTRRKAFLSKDSASKKPCPICSNTIVVEDVQEGVIKEATDFLRKKILPWIDGPYDTIRKLSSYMSIPLFKNLPVLTARNGKGCGSPNCVDGFVEDISEHIIQDVGSDGSAKEIDLKDILCGSSSDDESSGNTAATIKSILPKIIKLEKDQGVGGHKTIVSKGDVLYKTGIVKNDLNPYVENGTHNYMFYFEPGKGKYQQNLIPGGRGNCPKVYRIEPPNLLGNFVVDAANNITLNAGTPGIDLLSNGHINLNGGSIEVMASQGEALIGSGNLTIVKGKNIVLDADDKTGDSGVFVDAKSTMINGAFNVAGDAAFKGNITVDGALSVPYIVAPTMRLETEISGPSRTVAGRAAWGNEKIMGQVQSFEKDSFRKYNSPERLTTYEGLVGYALELYDMPSRYIGPKEDEMEECITGWAYTGGIFSKGTIKIFNADKGDYDSIEVEVESLPSWSPVYNYKHNHSQYGEGHTHSFTALKGSYYKDREAWGSERGSGINSMPSPSPTHGDGPSPGGKSKNRSNSDTNQFEEKIQDRNKKFKADQVFDQSNVVNSSVLENHLRDQDGGVRGADFSVTED